MLLKIKKKVYNYSKIKILKNKNFIFSIKIIFLYILKAFS